MAGSRRPLTHTLTHTGKRADGDNGHKSSGKDGTSGAKRVQKGLKAANPILPISW